ncbi:hypothetical protein CR970_00630 [Candidatus Saccharibacteria bacterium]|nr:MAG: hypothetical protein CR970_00630 [Candidatus Saccharibacteria bacterium]
MTKTKRITIEGIGDVTLRKRSGMRSIRLSLGQNGTVSASLPSFVPFAAGAAFVETKRDWIAEHQPPQRLLCNEQRIGKQHVLRFMRSTGSTTRTRLTAEQAIVALPSDVTPESPQAQKAARNVRVKALRREAQAYLPQRLQALANQHDFTYRNVSIKHMRSRWGSCNQDKDIALNCLLMDLDYAQMDYVILHELVHTRIMAHGSAFWDELSRYVPHLQAMRKRMRATRADH